MRDWPERRCERVAANSCAQLRCRITSAKGVAVDRKMIAALMLTSSAVRLALRTCTVLHMCMAPRAATHGHTHISDVVTTRWHMLTETWAYVLSHNGRRLPRLSPSSPLSSSDQKVPSPYIFGGFPIASSVSNQGLLAFSPTFKPARGS